MRAAVADLAVVLQAGSEGAAVATALWEGPAAAADAMAASKVQTAVLRAASVVRAEGRGRSTAR